MPKETRFWKKCVPAFAFSGARYHLHYLLKVAHRSLGCLSQQCNVCRWCLTTELGSPCSSVLFLSDQDKQACIPHSESRSKIKLNKMHRLTASLNLRFRFDMTGTRSFALVGSKLSGSTKTWQESMLLDHMPECWIQLRYLGHPVLLHCRAHDELPQLRCQVLAEC